jgi:hypothetical protein
MLEWRLPSVQIGFVFYRRQRVAGWGQDDQVRHGLTRRISFFIDINYSRIHPAIQYEQKQCLHNIVLPAAVVNFVSSLS